MSTISGSCTGILRVFNSLLRKNFQITQLADINVWKGETKKYILPTNKIEFRSLASLSKRRKFEEEKNNEKLKSKENKTNLSNDTLKEKETIKNKAKENDFKKFRINDVISDHDLQIKINSILKYLDKGRKILCEITTTSVEGNKFDICLEKLNNSKLKEHFVRCAKTKSKLSVTYQKKVTEKEPDEGQDKKITESS